MDLVLQGCRDCLAVAVASYYTADGQWLLPAVCWYGGDELDMIANLNGPVAALHHGPLPVQC